MILSFILESGKFDVLWDSSNKCFTSIVMNRRGAVVYLEYRYYQNLR